MTKHLYKYFLSLGFGFISAASFADSWTDILPASGFGYAVTADCSYDEANNLLYVLWPNQSGDFKAARYDYTSRIWTPIPPFPVFGTQTDIINSCYDSFRQRIYAAWSDNSTNKLAVAYYNGTNWINISPATPPVDASSYNVGCCSNGAGRIYFTWAKTTSAFQAAYYDGSFYDISGLSLPGSANSVDCCYNSTNGRIYAVWPGSPTDDLKAAYYNGAGWTEISPDPLLGFIHLGLITKCCYDSNRDRVYVTWPDSVSHEVQAAYYDVTLETWNHASPDPGTGISAFFIDCCFSSANHRIYETSPAVSSTQVNVGAAYYDGAPWTSIPPGFGGPGSFGVACCYDSINNRVYTSYADFSTHEIHAAVYTVTGSTTFTMTGIQLKNDFAVVSEQYNSLFWQNPATSTASYHIERNGVLIATLPGSAASYDDHNRIASVTDTYLLTALDVSGNVIGTATVSVRGSR